MVGPQLVRSTSHGVALLGDPHRPGGVTFAFTERTGGVSKGCYASLNLGDSCGDDLGAVAANRSLVLEAIGAGGHADALVNPVQVHGSEVVVVGGGGLGVRDAQHAARLGADAIVCVARGVPVLICCADCVPVLLAGPGGFAVVHSGWRGTLARIAAQALRTLVGELRCEPDAVFAYVGPHIGAAEYDVSEDLARRFEDEFGPGVVYGDRNVGLGAAIALTLEDEGLPRSGICVCAESTAVHTDRFFSYRAEGGQCGRQGVIAYLPQEEGVGEV